MSVRGSAKEVAQVFREIQITSATINKMPTIVQMMPLFILSMLADRGVLMRVDHFPRNK
jgi:hypothetical protein